ncbi:MAG: hypothetical protein QGF94_00135 [Candidatus Thalassarchaeaceae archaeon]|jgi:hypothetical protein|nr:hypothetical protein [Candidatus Thalassarchaeaceae archaeon]
MADDEEDLVVSLPVMDSPPKRTGIFTQIKNGFGAIRLIWYELTSGIGAWGSVKPLLAALLAAIPFLFIGQHFNRQHQKGLDWTLLQIPLILTIVLWPILFIWSIIDAYRIAMIDVTNAENNRRIIAALE